MLVVETGVGLENANSYVDLAVADDYFSTRSITKWSDATTAVRSAALIRATDYIDATYAFSETKTETQSLSWPIADRIGIPIQLKRAVMELALIAIDGDLVPATPDRIVTTEEKKLGSMSAKVVYDIAQISDRFPHITAMLSKLVRPAPRGFNEVTLLP